MVQRILIKDNLLTIFASGFDDVITTNDHVNIKRLYKFLRSSESMEALKKNWNLHIRKRGEVIVNMENQDEIT